MVYYFFIVGIVGVACTMYYIINSFEVHEDVDYVSSSEMEKIIGVENDEKIQITYQNFDLAKRKKMKAGCNILMVTDRKIYFAYYKQNHWSYMIKRIEEIYRIGYTGTEEDMFLELDFSDETILMLHMLVYGKATSNSTLFLKRFLEILDSVVLGCVDEKIKSRRRVSVNKGNSSVSKEMPIVEGRLLEINNYIVEGLKTAAPVESGRVLEF